MTRARERGIQLAMSFALLLLAAASVEAQNPRTALTINSTVVFPAPTANDYAAGFVNSTAGVTFTVDATVGNEAHTTTVLIRSLSANLGGTKPLGDLQWRRSDLATWTSISVANVQVEQRPQVRNVLNDPWTNTIFFRMVLNWATDVPGTYGANYQLTLSQTVP
jgi:hypothetical protein